jgi:hypothetical protein
MPRPADGSRDAKGAATTRAPFFFEGIESPNGTIFPDALLDQVMPFLTPTEWKVCSYIVRRTFGWKKASDRISLEQICHGIVRRDGSRLDSGTQLDRKTAIKALRGLETKGVIVAQRNYSDARGFEATTYGLRFRGQSPSRTLVEKNPQGGGDQGEIFHQVEGEQVHQGPGEDLHQAGGSTPPALVAHDHLQSTPGTSSQILVQPAGERGEARNRATRRPTIPPGGSILANAAGLAGPDVAAGASPAVVSEDGNLWSIALGRLEQQMTLANYQTWLADTYPLGRRGKTLVVGAPSGFVRDWLETRFRTLVRRVLREVGADVDDVSFAVAPSNGLSGADA